MKKGTIKTNNEDWMIENEIDLDDEYKFIEGDFGMTKEDSEDLFDVTVYDDDSVHDCDKKHIVWTNRDACIKYADVGFEF